MPTVAPIGSSAAVASVRDAPAVVVPSAAGVADSPAGAGAGAVAAAGAATAPAAVSSSSMPRKSIFAPVGRTWSSTSRLEVSASFGTALPSETSSR